MPFAFDLKLEMPASTPATAPKTAEVVIPAGAVIDEVVLIVPAGHQGTAPVWFEENGSKVFPSKTDGGQGEYRLNDVSLVVLKDTEYEFRFTGRFALVGYNEDTVNPHTTRAFVRGRYKEDRNRAPAPPRAAPPPPPARPPLRWW